MACDDLCFHEIYFYYERDEKLTLKDGGEEMEQDVQFFKSFAHYSITHYVGRSVYLFVCLSVGPSICWSLHLLVRPFISPSIALLISDTVFLVFTSDFNDASPAQMFFSNFPHYPCPPHTQFRETSTQDCFFAGLAVLPSGSVNL